MVHVSVFPFVPTYDYILIFLKVVRVMVVPLAPLHLQKGQRPLSIAVDGFAATSQMVEATPRRCPSTSLVMSQFYSNSKNFHS